MTNAGPRRHYPDRPVVGIGAVVVVDGKVVLVRRRNEPLAGRWSLPGGVVELGETLASGVVREVREETGLEVAVGRVVDVVDRVYRDDEGRIAYHYVLVDYVCRVVGGALQAGTDASEVAVVSEDEWERYGIKGDTRRVIAAGLAMAANL